MQKLCLLKVQDFLYLPGCSSILTPSHLLTFSPSHPLTVLPSYIYSMNLQSISRPTLLLDEERCRRNIQKMAVKSTSKGIRLRPHFKTHQSRTIGAWFREYGTHAITVSSVGMARYFMEDGWKDILIAFPVNLRQLPEMMEMARRIQLGVVVLDHHVVDIMGKQVDSPLNVWVKVDVGTHRTGVNPDDLIGVEQILTSIVRYPHLQFQGFLAHAGHSYKGRSMPEQQRIYDQALATMVGLKDHFRSAYPGIQISLGDTPGSSLVSHLGDVDELRPGNYVFYDLMQAEIGACTLDDIAVAMVCPVVAVHPERKQWVIYGGAIHFSKDHLLPSNGTSLYGLMVREGANTWEVAHAEHNPRIISLSQEHGIVQCTDENFKWCKPGDLALWLPVHSCLTADAMGAYLTLDGQQIDHYRSHFYDL
jgi:D-serine deaminase-like pyridoxal phosphate-dependent protein